MDLIQFQTNETAIDINHFNFDQLLGLINGLYIIKYIFYNRIIIIFLLVIKIMFITVYLYFDVIYVIVLC